jgi:hypothetical protein
VRVHHEHAPQSVVSTKTMTRITLTIDLLCKEAQAFSDMESTHTEPKLFGVTDGKAIGTYLEHKFRTYLQGRYEFEQGNSANGIDFPGYEGLSRRLLP